MVNRTGESSEDIVSPLMSCSCSGEMSWQISNGLYWFLQGQAVYSPPSNGLALYRAKTTATMLDVTFTGT